MINIEINDVIIENNNIYKVIYVCNISNTMDLKSWTEPMIIRAIPITNLYEISNVTIMKNIPTNVLFLSNYRKESFKNDKENYNR